MADGKKVVMQFKKTASAEDKAKFLDTLMKDNNAQVTNDDNVNSRVMPFVAFTIPDEHFESLRTQSFGGQHAVIEHVEEDTEMRIQ